MKPRVLEAYAIDHLSIKGEHLSTAQSRQQGDAPETFEL
jgi:hypothetical protein